MIAVTYARDVVEEAVLLAERGRLCDARAFRRARDVAYQMEMPTRENQRFIGAREWFARWGLDRPIGQGGRGRSVARLSHCRVLRTGRPQDEGAELFDRAVPAGDTNRAPLLVITVRPALLLDPPSVSRLLRHELAHVADMLDPAFAYQRALPPSDGGPSADNIARDRYRVLWDVTSWTRLRAPRLGTTRPAGSQFTKAFPMLGSMQGNCSVVRSCRAHTWGSLSSS
jgi:hypothetical protein